MIRLRRTCREAAALIVAREDRLLPFKDRLALKLHLMVCKTCPRFERQIRVMHDAFAQWRKGEDEDAI
jgi:hypothetical protein